MAENFTVILKQANLETNADTDDFVEKTDFDDKLKTFNEKVTSSKIKNVEIKKKFTDRTKKVAQISEKEYDCLLDRML